MNERKLEMIYRSTEEHIANVFTKALRIDKLEKLRKELGAAYLKYLK